MTRQGRFLAGGILILIGVVALVGAIFHVSFGELCFPLGLVVVGVLLLFRPHWSLPNADAHIFPLGDLRRSGEWQVETEEIWTFVSNINLDFSAAHIPSGETAIRISGFVTDIDVIVPPEVGVAVTASAFAMDSKILGQKRELFLSSAADASPNYEDAERKLHLELNCFVVDLSVFNSGAKNTA